MATTATTRTPRWADLDAAAEYWRVSKKTLRRMIAAGVIPAYRIGPRMIRVDLNDLDGAARQVPTAGGDVA